MFFRAITRKKDGSNGYRHTPTPLSLRNCQGATDDRRSTAALDLGLLRFGNSGGLLLDEYFLHLL
jgi:hypothetical protein